MNDENGVAERVYNLLTGAEELLGGRPRADSPTYREGRAAALSTSSEGEAKHGGLGKGDTPVGKAPYEGKQTVVSPRESNVSTKEAIEPESPGDLAPSEGTREERLALLEEINASIRSCRKCPLSLGRTLAVPGAGALDPLVMLVGEGPGFHEDQDGVPFVGNAGAYLDKWMASINLHRERDLYISNVVKCRPPNNRDPKPEELDSCVPYLFRQIELVRPRMIVTLGRISMRILTKTTQGITRIHGRFFEYRGIPVVPTFHPSAVLRRSEYRRPVWEDLKKVRSWLDEHPMDTGHDRRDR